MLLTMIIIELVEITQHKNFCPLRNAQILHSSSIKDNNRVYSLMRSLLFSTD